MLQKLKDRRQAGFTLVELLIVIVVIAILAAIVINTFSGVQQRARDTERQTDIKAVASQLEVYYTNKGYYPTPAILSDNTQINTELKGLSLDAVRDPQDTTTNSFNGTSTAPSSTNKKYRYVVPAGCVTATPTGCTYFTLEYYNEQDNTVKQVKSVGNAPPSS